MEPEPVAEPVLALAAELADEGGPRWLVESEESSSHNWMLEWMTAPYASYYRRSPATRTPPLVVEVSSSQSSLEFAVVPDLDRLGPSRTVGVVVSSDSSSGEDPDSPYCPDTPPSERDQ